MRENPSLDVNRYGPWALIVGGSEGIGAASACLLAAQGFNLILVARKAEPLSALAQELAGAGVEVRTGSVDLSQPDALDRTRALTDDIEVGLLLYIAGANDTRGNFLELDPQVYRSVIAITVIGQAEFTRHYGGLMRERGRGGIILAGSLSNFCGSATVAAYTGAKAFSRVFTEALWAECVEMNIDVLHVVVGYTDTPAMRRLGLDTSSAQSPEDAACEMLAAIGNGPLLLLGGEASLKIATARSQLADRGEVIRTAGTPRRESMPHVSAN
ncbi:MAG TPA: SDR family NAD(P)-dependent oxidoreductase [Sphingobium sp.]|uniref:SDR family NAD(P)-dependent oxidoreductase n=1 Tax=Sphingobium sp. TaxID=1912891 RepID=UPI002ED1EB65